MWRSLDADRVARAKRDPLVLVAAILGVTGLVVLLRGLLDGVPFIYWGTTEEHAAREYGRLEILVASGVLVAAGALLSLRRSVTYGIAVAAVGPITAMVTFLMPGTAAAWLAFLFLSPLALGVWVVELAG
jgi:hypothetical protein